MNDLDSLAQTALADIAAAATLDALDAIRVRLLGKSGAITEQLKSLGKLPPEERKAHGELVNRARDELTVAIAARKEVLEESAFAQRLASERIDVTLPGRNGERGAIHPVTRTLARITEIFSRLGYRWPMARRSRTTGTTSRR
jgi:phenylalanyl-tRNA synthetase alpha chain